MVVLACAAKLPACTVAGCTVSPPFVVQAERLPDSKPSWNTTDPGVGVLVDVAGAPVGVGVEVDVWVGVGVLVDVAGAPVGVDVEVGV